MGGADPLSSSLRPISYHSGTGEAMHLSYRQALSQPSSAPPLLLWRPSHMIYSARVATAKSENIFIKIWVLLQNSKNESNSSFFFFKNQISTGDFSKRVQRLIVRTIISWCNVYVSDKCFYYNKFTVAGNGKCISWVDLCLPERVYWSLKLLEHDLIWSWVFIEVIKLNDVTRISLNWTGSMSL